MYSATCNLYKLSFRLININICVDDLCCLTPLPALLSLSCLPDYIDRESRSAVGDRGNGACHM